MPGEEPLAVLEGLLDAENHAIRAGEFAGLAELAAAKTQAMERLTGAGALPERLARLRAKAEANQHLLAAALEGVRAAERRIAAILRAGEGLTTYDARGRAQTLPRARRGMERRA